MPKPTNKYIVILASLALTACSQLPNARRLIPATLTEADPTTVGASAIIKPLTGTANLTAGGSIASTNLSSAVTAVASNTPSPSNTPKPAATATALPPSPLLTPTRIVPTAIATPSTSINVNSFEQEVFPFKKNGNCTLGEAIWAAQTQLPQDGCKAGGAEGSTIILRSGVYTFSQADSKSTIVLPDIDLPQTDSALAALPVIGGQVTIVGNGAVLRRVGTQAFRFFDVHPAGELTLQNLTLTGGDPGKLDGGAIQNLGQTRLLNVTLSNNSAYDGGAIANLNYVEIAYSLLISNTARHYGGALYGEGGKFDLRDARLIGNTATEVGGGLYGVRTKFDLAHSVLADNTAVLGGGAYNEDSSLTINDESIVIGNRATQDMGKANIAYGGGGIVSFGTESVLMIEDSKLLNNRAIKSSGGALSNWSGSVAITRTVISGNVAAVAGAVLDGYFGGVTSIADSCILSNGSLRSNDVIVALTKISLDASNNWWGSADGPPTPTPTPAPTLAPTKTALPITRTVAAPTINPSGTPIVITRTPSPTPVPSVIIDSALSEAPAICR